MSCGGFLPDERNDETKTKVSENGFMGKRISCTRKRSSSKGKGKCSEGEGNWLKFVYYVLFVVLCIIFKRHVKNISMSSNSWN